VTPAPVSAIKLSAVNAKVKGVNNTTVRWTGATGTTVTLLVNGVRSTVPNTGSYINKFKGSAAITYQVCDTAGCSNTVTIRILEELVYKQLPGAKRFGATPGSF
jgi:hypothetical protein